MFRSLLILIAFWAQQVVWANCTTPSLLTAISTTDYSANLTWTNVGDAYELELRQANQTFNGVPTHTVPLGPPFVATGLIPGENYKFRVRTLCTGGGTSTWSTARNFSTQLNNVRPCPLDFTLRDTSCATTSQFFTLHVDNAPGTALGTDVLLKALRLVIVHPWRSDLRVWLHNPNGTKVQVIGGLNAGDQNLGDPTGNGGCGQYLELSDAPSAPLLSTAAEQDNITGTWRSLSPLADLQTGQNPNGEWLLEICDSKLNHTGKLRLAQLVFEAVDCPAPFAPSVQNIGLNNADVMANLGGISTDSIEWVYGPKGFLPEISGQRLVLPGTAPIPFTLSNLIALQSYDVFLRVRCTSTGTWSGYSPPASFFTVCPDAIREDFEALSTCPTGCTDPCPLPGTWQNVPEDDYEWKVRAGTGITYPTAGPQTGAGGSGNYLFFRNSCSASGANGKKAILRTRCLDITAPAGPPCHFSMDVYMNTKLGQMGTLALQGSTNGGVTWQTIHTWSGNQGKQWKQLFVDLSAFNGQTAIFQLVATGVFGAYGDIAVDNLVFYGATPAGSPDYTFYRDNDGDGFGNNADRVVSCSPDTPAGYTTNGTDCNDNNAQIHPDRPEILCNGLDDNCNGPADDTDIPAPLVTGPSTVCMGATAGLNIVAPAKGQYFWFDAPLGGQLLGTDNELVINNLTQNTTVWAVDSFANGGCASNRTPITIIVAPKPDLVLGQSAAICKGSSLNLTELPLNDLNSTTGTLTYHSGATGIPLVSTTVQPNSSTIYFAQKTTPEGCTDTAQIAVTVYDLPIVTILNGDSLALCKGKSIVLTAQGSGLSPLQYQWSNGLFQNNIEVTATGNGTVSYTVTVRDQNGCTQKDVFKLTALAGVSQTNVVQLQHVSLCGGNDGRIGLRPLDGLPPYQFQWAGPNQTNGTLNNIGSNGGNITGLTQGGYRVTITDATGSGCSMVLPPLVLNAPGFSVNTPEITQPTCANGTGSIMITAVGNAPVYLWSNAATTATVSGLPPGSYTVTITDGACSQVISGLNLVAPSPVQTIINQITPINCAAQTNGSIDIAATGGTGPYSYLWNDQATTQDRSQLAPGVYQVTVTDARGCSSVSPQWPILAPPPLSISAQTQPANCFGAATGSTQINVTGGNGNYFIEWNTGDFTAQLLNVSAGTYTVTVTDAKSCAATRTVSITQPAALNISPNIQNPTCTGKMDGQLSVTVIGGTGGIGFLWDNNANTNTLALLPEGQYRVTATDANGCTSEGGPYTLTAPAVINLQIPQLVPARCFGENSGTIDATATSAYGDVTLYLSGVPTNFPQSNLLAGSYLIQAIDTNGCFKDTLVNLPQPTAPLSLNVEAFQPVSCQGEPTGAINVQTTGGTAPYQYLWSNGSTTEDLDAAPAGEYYLAVSDANGCQGGIANLALSEPPPLSVDIQTLDVECIGAPLGKIILAASGGNAPYYYQWSNGATTASLFDVPAGPYAVSIFDAVGCLTVLDHLEIVDKQTAFGVQFAGYSPVSCNAGNDGWLQAQVLNGTPPFQYSWSAPVGLHANVPTTTDNAINLSGGFYTVTVTDAAGCYRSAGPFLVEEAPLLVAQTPSPALIACKGEATGQATAFGTGGVPPISFNWSNGSTNATNGGLLAGLYLVTLTDSRGCTVVSDTVFVSEPAVGLLIQTAALEEDFCSDTSGAIYITAQGGHLGYDYAWNTGNSTAHLIGVPAGQYTLTVTDGEGCSVTQTWTLADQPPAMTLGSYSITPVACKGAATGRIEIGITGGHPPLNYFWDNGLTTANINDLVAGNYRVTVQDQAGCLGTFDVPPVTEPDWALAVTYTSISLSGGYTVVLDITGGTPGYTVTWDEATGYQVGPVASNLSGGYYSVTLTDAGGCTLVTNIYAGPSSTNDPTALLKAAAIAPNPAFGTAKVTLNGLSSMGGEWQLLRPDGGMAQSGTWAEHTPYFILETTTTGIYYLILKGERLQVLKWVKL